MLDYYYYLIKNKTTKTQTKTITITKRIGLLLNETLDTDFIAAIRNGQTFLNLLKVIDPSKFKEIKFPKTGDDNVFQINENLKR